MDTEFINLFIQKQQASLNDLNNKILMAETRVQILESRLGTKNSDYDQLVIDFNKLKGELADINHALKSKKTS